MKRALTGIKPTADQLHFGNYFGAVKPLLELQEKGEHEIFVFVADLHASTAFYDSKAISQNIINVVKTYLACGLDPEKVIIYKQSDIPAHAQLNWNLACITNIGFMKRMHAFKDAINKGKEEDVTMGTFNYPILMAADIIMYDPDVVPVGKDQKQHVEFARDVAGKFNHLFGETFKLPQPMIQESVATVPGIDGRKMSKSYNNFIGIFEDEKTILKKCKSVVTESLTLEEPKDPDSCNIFAMLKLFMSTEEESTWRTKYTAGGLGFGEAKKFLFEKVWEFVQPIQQRAAEISDEDVIKVLKNGLAKAKPLADAKIKDVYDKVGYNIY